MVGRQVASGIRIPAEEVSLVQGAVSLALRALSPEINPTREVRNRALTEKELRVLQLIAKGKTNKEIAPEILLSVASVKKLVQDMLRKLNARDRKDAVACISTSGSPQQLSAIPPVRGPGVLG